MASPAPRLDRSIPTLRVIIPAKDEAPRIGETVEAFCRFFGERASVIVVANGCTDRTCEVVRDVQKSYPALEMLTIAAPVGKGGAVRAGLTTGVEPFLALVDADGSAKPEQIETLWRACIAMDLAGAIGSRWLRDSEIGRRQTFKRRLASRTFNLIVRALFGLPYSDTQCGAKVFRRSSIDGVIRHLEIANFAFDVDLLFALRRGGQRVVEVPIAWNDVPEYSSVSIAKAAPSMLAAIARLRLRHSPLRHLPFLDILARASTIPVMQGLSVLVLTTKSELPASVDALVQAYRASGHRVAIRRIRNPIDFVAFGWEYITRGHHTYHILVDCCADVISRLISFSVKPKVRLEVLERTPPERWAAIVEGTTKKCGYNGLFWLAPDGWMLLTSSPTATLLQQS